jgi:NADH-ubiquinone oxidoreductase chain 2
MDTDNIIENVELNKGSKNIEYILEDYTDKILTNFHSFLISSLTLLILFFFIKPSLILNSTLVLSLSLFKV